MLNPGEFRQALLKFRNLRPQYPLAAFNGRHDRAVEGFAEPATLCLQIDK
jgi:hypothetical protein